MAAKRVQFYEKKLFKDFRVCNQSFDKSGNNVITSKQIIRNSIDFVKLQKSQGNTTHQSTQNNLNQVQQPLTTTFSDYQDKKSENNRYKMIETKEAESDAGIINKNHLNMLSFAVGSPRSYKEHSTLQSKQPNESSLMPKDVNKSDSKAANYQASSQKVLNADDVYLTEALTKELNMPPGENRVSTTQSLSIDIHSRIEQMRDSYTQKKQSQFALKSYDRIHPYTRASAMNESLGMKMIRRSQEMANRSANQSSVKTKKHTIFNSRNNTFQNSIVQNNEYANETVGDSILQDKAANNSPYIRSSIDFYREGQIINQSNKKVYKQNKNEKYESSVFNPPSIITQLKYKGKNGNNPEAYHNKSVQDIDFNKIKIISQPANENLSKNSQTQEFQTIDRRPKVNTTSSNFLNWTIQQTQKNTVNASTRIMSAYRDQVNNPHFSSQYRQKVDNFPSVFRKTNGEFSAYASAFSGHKVVMCKNFSPAQRNSLKL